MSKNPKQRRYHSLSNASNPSDSPNLSGTGTLVPVLMYGGVAVAVIIAISYFSQIQLKSSQ